jgi:branched-chain amino acid transport system ATP-binding protein
MLSVSALHGGYGRIPILNAISFEVAKGEFVGIFGHNGMGKTTLLRVLAGQLPATSGTVALEGRDITRLAPHVRARLGLGYVPQGRQIFPQLTVLENLRMGAIGAGRGEDEIERVLSLFPRLKELRGRVGGVLSGGEQQILAIARCLCGRPAILLLDEPTEGVQPSIIEEIIEILARLRDNTGVTVVLVEQSLDFISRLASRILIIQKGMISRSMRTQELDTIADEFLGLHAAAH